MGLVQRVKDTAKRIPIFVTEWGTSQASGNGGPYLSEAKQFLDVFNNVGGATGQTISWAQWSVRIKRAANFVMLDSRRVFVGTPGTKGAGIR